MNLTSHEIGSVIPEVVIARAHFFFVGNFILILKYFFPQNRTGTRIEGFGGRGADYFNCSQRPEACICMSNSTSALVFVIESLPGGGQQMRIRQPPEVPRQHFETFDRGTVKVVRQVYYQTHSSLFLYNLRDTASNRQAFLIQASPLPHARNNMPIYPPPTMQSLRDDEREEQFVELLIQAINPTMEAGAVGGTFPQSQRKKTTKPTYAESPLKKAVESSSRGSRFKTPQTPTNQRLTNMMQRGGGGTILENPAFTNALTDMQEAQPLLGEVSGLFFFQRR